MQTRKRRQYEDKVSKWASGKAELSALQQETYSDKQEQAKRFREEEHKLKMDFERQIYEARLLEIKNRIICDKKKMKQK